jgi:CheY-like chemotaxis protein
LLRRALDRRTLNGMSHNGKPATFAEGLRLSLESVITTAELRRRPHRAPDYEGENRVLVSLAGEMASTPRNVLQKLAENALGLCRAQSAGISILEEHDGERMFRWHAVAGRWAGYLGSVMPREISPCGTVLDRNASLLMSRPERHFPFPPEVTPGIEEVLLVPFHVSGKPIGTLWVIAHDGTRKFDEEDDRLLRSLGQFASSAYQVLGSLDALVRLPLASAAGIAPSATEPGARSEPRRILVVDDNQDAAESLSLLLTSAGHSVQVAFDGDAALRVGAEFEPELVFLDIGMPKTNGYDAARNMRAESWGKSVHLVALTGWGQEEDKRRAEAAGFNAHLVKPVSPEALRQQIATLRS